MLIFIRKVCICRRHLPQHLRRHSFDPDTALRTAVAEQAEYGKSWHLLQEQWQAHSSCASATSRVYAQVLWAMPGPWTLYCLPQIYQVKIDFQEHYWKKKVAVLV